MDFVYAVCPGQKCSVISPGRVNQQVKGLIQLSSTTSAISYTRTRIIFQRVASRASKSHLVTDKVNCLIVRGCDLKKLKAKLRVCCSVLKICDESSLRIPAVLYRPVDSEIIIIIKGLQVVLAYGVSTIACSWWLEERWSVFGYYRKSMQYFVKKFVM